MTLQFRDQGWPVNVRLVPLAAVLSAPEAPRISTALPTAVGDPIP